MVGEIVDEMVGDGKAETTFVSAEALAKNAARARSAWRRVEHHDAGFALRRDVDAGVDGGGFGGVEDLADEGLVGGEIAEDAGPAGPTEERMA